MTATSNSWEDPEKVAQQATEEARSAKQNRQLGAMRNTSSNLLDVHKWERRVLEGRIRKLPIR
jgi:ribosomal protein S6